VYEDSLTNNIIPLLITIIPRPNGTYAFSHARLLVAMMKALQIAFQDSYLGAINDNSTTKRLNHHSQIPITTKELQNYMLKPVAGANNVYTTKIKVYSNYELKDYLLDPSFRNCMAAELISIKYNRLTTVLPCNVGILEQITVTRDTNTMMHTDSE
jgi:hypothetical protein